MNLRLPFAFALCSIGSLAMAQQLPPDHYLVGTQGWVNNKPSDKLNTIQVISPYTGKATMLRTTGLPPGQAAACFVIQSNGSFLLGTKSLNTEVASGHVFRANLQKNNTWKITKFSQWDYLGINVSDMVVTKTHAYVIGSSAFNNSGSDALILRISLTTGKVNFHCFLGAAYKVLKRGAYGLGSSLLLVGNTLHAFTFDTTTKTAKNNEHWTISTSLPVKVSQLPSIPVSRRRVTNQVAAGFGTSSAFMDPKNPTQLVVVGRWGEIHWLNSAGNSVRYEAFPGTISNVYNHLGELWRGVALNTNTHAFGLGDHNNASIDERRIANSTKATEPFANDIAKAIRPALNLKPGDTVLYTIAGMEYLPGPSSYRPIGNGCPDGTNGIPMSYASGAPARGNASFGFSLHARPQGRTPTTAGILWVSGTRLPTGISLGTVAPGCKLFVNPSTLGIIAPTASRSSDLNFGPFALPSRKGVTVYTQWAVLAPKANALGLILSDARALRL